MLAVLMDSCAMMRGCKIGLEKRLRDGPVPHLLDIDGDLSRTISKSCFEICTEILI